MNKNTILFNFSKSKEELAKWFYEWYTGEPSGYFDDWYWIGGGTTLGIGDIFVDLDNIVNIMVNNISREAFGDWYDYGLDQSYMDEDKCDRVDLKSYAKIRGTGTHEDYIAFREEQERIRSTPEYQKQCEEDLKKIFEDGVKELKKYIK